MSEKIFLHLLILCIWSQGIIVTLADEETKESSRFLVRKKRVVTHAQGEDIAIHISSAPYVVIIKLSGRIKCVGSILSQHAAITAASCVEMRPEEYQIYYRTTRSNRGLSLNVTGISRFFGHNIGEDEDGIAVVSVNSIFIYSAYSMPIQLYTGALQPGTLGKVSGWGYYFLAGEGRAAQNITGLRTIDVPIIPHQECVNIYRRHAEISNKNICTYHPNRHCGHTDIGAGLVVNGHLVGVFLHSGRGKGQIDPRYPDVFARLQELEYHNWIKTKLESINLRYNRNQH